MHTMSAPNSRWARFLRPGALMMALGAVLILAGVIQTTSSHFNTNLSCPSGTTLVAKFNYDGHGHNYDFDSPAGNADVVTLSHTSSHGGWWSSTQPLSALIVKGDSASVSYSISPPQVTGSFSNDGLSNGHGHDQDSHEITSVQFCGSNVPAGTTTSASSSTSSSTTSSSTSTTGSATTTSTTCSECATTSTTYHPPTTCGCSTTTYHPPTTCKCTSTTTTPHEETTQPHETTTTVVDTTTSSTEVSGSTLVASSTTAKTTSTTSKRLGGETTVVGQGTSTSFGPTVSSTSVVTPDGGGSLPFTGSSSTPIVALGVILLATGLTLTLSQARRRERTQS
jgi:hypothetical protein